MADLGARKETQFPILFPIITATSLTDQSTSNHWPSISSACDVDQVRMCCRLLSCFTSSPTDETCQHIDRAEHQSRFLFPASLSFCPIPSGAIARVYAYTRSLVLSRIWSGRGVGDRARDCWGSRLTGGARRSWPIMADQSPHISQHMPRTATWTARASRLPSILTPSTRPCIRSGSRLMILCCGVSCFCHHGVDIVCALSYMVCTQTPRCVNNQRTNHHDFTGNL